MPSLFLLNRKEMKMKVISLNTHSWIEENPLEKLVQIGDFILKEEVEVIALQEVNQKISAEIAKLNEFYCSYEGAEVEIKADNFAKLLVDYLKEKGQTYYWGWTCSHIGYDIYDEGSAVLSKYPFKAESLLVSPTQDRTDYHTRRILLAHLNELTVGSCHYSWYSKNPEEGFIYEWNQLLADTEKNNHQVLLLGDFNAPAHIEGEGYSLVTETYTDVYTLAKEKIGNYTVESNIDGWADNKESLRIDFGFVSKPVEVISYEVIFNGIKTPVVSDHFGILLDLKL